LPDLSSRLHDGLAGSYTLERELGRGGMAIVWLAHDLKHDREVAIKVVRPELAAALGAERFLREIRIAAHLQHPHILTLIDSGEIPPEGADGAGSLYYVMPYVEGETLRERLTREKTLSPGDTARILQQVLDALAYAHRLGSSTETSSGEHHAHRASRPGWTSVARRPAPLPIPYCLRGTLTALGLAIGTPTYMAPEQAAGQTMVDARADLYALGVVAYEMLGGRPPFTGTTPQAVLAAQITQSPPPLVQLRPDLDAPLAAAVMRCLEKEPARRWQSAEELLAHLEAFATPGSGVAAASAGQVPHGARRKHGALMGAAVLIVALGAALWQGPGRHASERRWARERAIPQLLALAENGEWETAYALARRVDAILPKDSLFNALRPRFARRTTIRTDPAGATVWRGAYGAPDSTWILLGRTPLDSALLALSGGGSFGNANRLRIEAPGYRTLDLVGLPFRDSMITLDREGSLPPEMVRIAGGELNVFYPGFEHVKPIRLGDYLMDRFEVTNREFKRFVDSGDTGAGTSGNIPSLRTAG
jgi:hypothetical protein